MKILKQTTAALLALVLVLGMIPVQSRAEEATETIPKETIAETEPTVVMETTVPEVWEITEVTAEETAAAVEANNQSAASGTCGKKLTWTLENGVLTISGKGSMNNYWSIEDIPWHNYWSEITQIVIENGVTSIGEWAFQWCTGVTSIVLPESITSIEQGAFFRCEALTAITLPSSITEIRLRAFQLCDSLTDVYYSGTIAQWKEINIGWDNESLTNARIHCNDLANGTCGENLTWMLKDGVLTISGTGSMENYPQVGSGAPWREYSSSISSIVIKEGVATIGNRAFCNLDYITDITLPDGITSIGEDAFNDCDNLESVTLPGSVTSIGNWAFTCCYRLASISLPDSMQTIGEGVFSDCKQLKSITLPSKLLSIGKYAFYGCESLTEITLPEDTAEIGEGAFACCGKLKSITLPAKLAIVNGDAFNSCDSLLFVYYGGTKTEWDSIMISGGNNDLLEAILYVQDEEEPTEPEETEPTIPEPTEPTVPEETEPDIPEESQPSGGNIGAGTPDSTPPVLHSITLSANTVTPGNTIEVIVDASDDVSGLDYGHIWFWCEDTDKELHCYVHTIKEEYWDEEGYHVEKYSDGKLHGTLEIDQYVETGTFQVRSVELLDIADNYHSYYMWAEPEYEPDRVFPESVKNLSFKVMKSDTPDSTPPVLHGITLSEHSVTAPGTLEVIVDASDDVSGLDYGYIYFWCEETQKELYCHVDTIKEEYWDEDGYHLETYEDGKLHGILNIDQYVETGTFKVRSVDLRDIAENYRSYYMWAEPEYEPDRVLPDAVKNLSFNVFESDTPDGTPPVLNKITLSAYSATAPGTLEVIVDASDNVSGLDYGYIYFWCEETQKELYCHVDTIKEEYWDEDGYHLETYEDGKLHGTLNIDQYVETGTFKVRSVDLRDIAENYRSYNMWAEPEYEPDRVFPESVKNLQLHIFNTIPDVTTSVANPGFIDKLESAEDNAYIVADYSGDATLTEDAFEAIAGTDKTLDLTSEGITWRFNGSDITEDIKPIDLKVDIQPMEFMFTPEAEEIQEKLDETPGVIMKFAENGTLPGKATIQVKVDYTMREYLGSEENLCVYYYNNQTGKLELIAEGLKVVGDTYVEFSITHCSYYVLTPKLPEEGCGYELGDVNHDTKINAKDATLILQKSVGVLKETAAFCEACAEVSGDGKLNAKDSTLILQFSVGLRDNFPGQK